MVKIKFKISVCHNQGKNQGQDPLKKQSKDAGQGEVSLRVGLRLKVNGQFCVGFRVKVRVKLMLRIKVSGSGFRSM